MQLEAPPLYETTPNISTAVPVSNEGFILAPHSPSEYREFPEVRNTFFFSGVPINKGYIGDTLFKETTISSLKLTESLHMPRSVGFRA